MVIVTVNFSQNYNLARIKVKITTLLPYALNTAKYLKVVSPYYINVLTYKVTTLKNVCNPIY
jgi:hypothetical protein